MKTGRYVGGPLDGQEAHSRNGVWCLYRDDAGRPIAAAQGDRHWLRREDWPTKYYHRQQELLTPNVAYVHASKWKDWCEDENRVQEQKRAASNLNAGITQWG